MTASLYQDGSPGRRSRSSVRSAILGRRRARRLGAAPPPLNEEDAGGEQNSAAEEQVRQFEADQAVDRPQRVAHAAPELARRTDLVSQSSGELGTSQALPFGVSQGQRHEPVGQL